MKPNKLTPGHNLLWESSRMMLPEHKQQINKQQKERLKRQKPLIDEQQAAIFARIISDALKLEQNIEVNLFDPYHDIYIAGKVQKIAPERRQIQLLSQDDMQWICFDDMIGVSLLEEDARDW